MKKAIIAIAIGAFALVGTATNTEARPYGGNGCRTSANTIYVSGYRHGRPVYTEKIFVGYDCHGRPRFTYRTVYASVRKYAPQCPLAYSTNHGGAHYQSHHSNSGATISFTFRR